MLENPYYTREIMVRTSCLTSEISSSKRTTPCESASSRVHNVWGAERGEGQRDPRYDVVLGDAPDLG